MGFFDFLKGKKGNKFEVKKPLTEPLGTLPPLDTSLPGDSFQPDLGVPKTSSIEPGQNVFSEREARLRMPEFSEPQQQFKGSPSYTSTSYTQTSPPVSLEKDIQIISSKLDYLKAMLENLNHRLEALERIAKGEEEEVKW